MGSTEAPDKTLLVVEDHPGWRKRPEGVWCRRVLMTTVAAISSEGVGSPGSVRGAARRPITGPGIPCRLPSEASTPPRALFRAWWAK